MAKTKTQPKEQQSTFLLILAVPVMLVALWWSTAGSVTAWAIRNGYFSAKHPVTALPGAHPAGAGPTLVTLAALLAMSVGILAAVMVGFRLAAPVQHDPDDRRPLPPVAAPVIAATTIIGATTILASVPLIPDLFAAPLGVVIGYTVGDVLSRKLSEYRDRARELNEIEWALYPYLGFDELPRKRIVAITEWDDATDDQSRKPREILLVYRGRREDLKPQLGQRLDDAAGSHYTMSYATTDQLITATLASANTESPLVRGLREQIATTDLFGATATLVITDEDYSESGDPIRFSVRHQIGAKLAGTDRLLTIARKFNDLGLPGRWRCVHSNNLAGIATFEIRNELPTCVYPPIRPAVTTIEEACKRYDSATIPLAVDEEGNLIEWALKINPHMLLMGPTGTGKTATIHNTIIASARLGAQIFIIDFKGGEFTNYRTYPNVVAVITEPQEAVALVNILYKEMRRRYNLYKRSKSALAGEVPFLIIFDEYAEFQEVIKTFYANTKGKGVCPTLAQFGSLLRLGRTCRLHCVAALQRADQKFLEGEAKDNFTMRLSLGKLSPIAAQMIHNDARAGRTIPLGIRGRGTALNRAGIPTEVQSFYVPDPDSTGDNDKRIMAELRPPTSLYQRGVIMPPDSDPTVEPEEFAVYQSLPLLKAEQYPQFDPHSTRYEPPRWLNFSDEGVDSIFGAGPGGPRRNITPDTPDELVDAYEANNSEIRQCSVNEIEVGDYLRQPDAQEWGILDEPPVVVNSRDAAILILRDIYSGDREEIEVSLNTRLDVRDLPESHIEG